MKSHLPHCKIRFLVFILYNLLYVTYMLGYTPQTYYLVILALFCGMNFAVILKKGGVLKNAIPEFKLGIGYVVVFLVISLFVQLINRDFESYLFSELLRIALPVISAFLIVNSVKSNDFVYFFNVLLARFTLHFVWENYSNFNLSNIMSISWSDSSSAMETSMAHDFLILEVYFLSKKNYKKAFFCMVLCMLSMKRLSFILAPTLFIGAQLLSRLDQPVKKSLLTVAKLIVIISPFVMFALYSDVSQNFFYQNFHLNLDVAMSGRISIYDTVVSNIPYFNGYGSINNFLSDFVFNTYGTSWNATLHNDFIRIFYETTIIGVVVLANNIFELSKRNYWHFIITFYLIFVAITSHILSYFSVWVTFYMIIMCSRVEEKELIGQINLEAKESIGD